MVTKSLFTLSKVIALGVRYAAKFLLFTSFLAVSGVAALPIREPFSYSIHGATVVRRSELGPLTTTAAYSLIAPRPGHELGPVRNASRFDIYLPGAVSPFIYTLPNGSVVERRSELGPLTAPAARSFASTGPGHDFGVISNVSRLDKYQSAAAASPFTYTLPNGSVVERRSELGPLTETLNGR